MSTFSKTEQELESLFEEFGKSEKKFSDENFSNAKFSPEIFDSFKAFHNHLSILNNQINSLDTVLSKFVLKAKETDPEKVIYGPSMIKRIQTQSQKFLELQNRFQPLWSNSNKIFAEFEKIQKDLELRKLEEIQKEKEKEIQRENERQREKEKEKELERLRAQKIKEENEKIENEKKLKEREKKIEETQKLKAQQSTQTGSENSLNSNGLQSNHFGQTQKDKLTNNAANPNTNIIRKDDSTAKPATSPSPSVNTPNVNVSISHSAAPLNNNNQTGNNNPPVPPTNNNNNPANNSNAVNDLNLSPLEISTRDLKSALSTMKASCDQESFKEALQTLQKFISNIISFPHDEKFRKIRRLNDVFKKRLGDKPGGNLALVAMGFSIEGVVEAEQHFVLKPSEQAWIILTNSKKIVDQELSSLPVTAPSASVPPAANPFAGLFGSNPLNPALSGSQLNNNNPFASLAGLLGRAQTPNQPSMNNNINPSPLTPGSGLNPLAMMNDPFFTALMSRPAIMNALMEQMMGRGDPNNFNSIMMREMFADPQLMAASMRSPLITQSITNSLNTLNRPNPATPANPANPNPSTAFPFPFPFPFPAGQPQSTVPVPVAVPSPSQAQAQNPPAPSSTTQPIGLAPVQASATAAQPQPQSQPQSQTNSHQRPAAAPTANSTTSNIGSSENLDDPLADLTDEELARLILDEDQNQNNQNPK